MFSPNIDNKLESAKLFALEDVLLASNVSPEVFSLRGYKDDCVCLEWAEDKWLVYIGKNGERLFLSAHEDILSAGESLIELLIPNDRLRRKMVVRLHKQTKRMTTWAKKRYYARLARLRQGKGYHL